MLKLNSNHSAVIIAAIAAAAIITAGEVWRV
jgi:hypothetical protein